MGVHTEQVEQHLYSKRHVKYTVVEATEYTDRPYLFIYLLNVEWGKYLAFHSFNIIQLCIHTILHVSIMYTKRYKGV